MLTSTQLGNAALLLLASFALHQIVVIARGRSGTRGNSDSGSFWFGDDGDGCGDGGD